MPSVRVIENKIEARLVKGTVAVRVKKNITQAIRINTGFNSISSANKIEKSFDFSDLGSPVLIGAIPAGVRIQEAVLVIQTAFDGNVQINIGDEVAQGRLMNAGDNEPDKVEIYTVEPHVSYDSQTLVSAYSTGSPTQGEATIIIYYI